MHGPSRRLRTLSVTRNPPSAGTERIDRRQIWYLSGLWEAIVFPSKTTSCNHSSLYSQFLTLLCSAPAAVKCHDPGHCASTRDIMHTVQYGIVPTLRCDFRDEFIRYRIAVCDAKSKFCDAKLNVIRRKLRCKAILTAQKFCLYAISVRAWVHALADCVPVCYQRSSLVRDFFLLVAGHSIRATVRVCHTHVVSLIFACAVLITSCKLRLTEWDVGLSKYFWQVSWVVEVDVERRGG